MEQDRRGFLQGMFGGVTAAGIVVMAPESVSAHFAAPLGSPVTVSQPTIAHFIAPGEQLYNAQGQVVAIVEDIHMSRNKIETSTHNDRTDQYVLGILRIDIRARGIPFDDYGKVMTCSYCGTPRPFMRPCLQCGAGPS